MPLFQRKGPPAPSGPDMGSMKGADHPEGSTPENKDVPDDGDMQTVTCPNCHCEFDPETGDLLNTPDDGMSGDDGSMGGQMHPDAGSYQMPDGMMPMGGEG